MRRPTTRAKFRRQIGFFLTSRVFSIPLSSHRLQQRRSNCIFATVSDGRAIADQSHRLKEEKSNSRGARGAIAEPSHRLKAEEPSECDGSDGDGAADAMSAKVEAHEELKGVVAEWDRSVDSSGWRLTSVGLGSLLVVGPNLLFLSTMAATAIATSTFLAGSWSSPLISVPPQLPPPRFVSSPPPGRPQPPLPPGHGGRGHSHLLLPRRAGASSSVRGGPSPSPTSAADAFEERGDSILHLLSPPLALCLSRCIFCWRASPTRIVP
jgi:hypothetical protein